MNRVLQLAAYQIRLLLSERMWLVLAWALYSLQLSIYGSLVSRLVTSVQDYFFYYAVGLMVMIVFDSASDLGRHLVEHGHEGELPYYLSLPISRRGFLAANLLYGGTNTVLRVFPPLVGALIFFNKLTAVGLAAALVALLFLGFGISSLMISLSFIAFKSIDLYNSALIGMAALLVRFSTVFYPLVFVDSQYRGAPYATPLTYGADLTRWVLGFDPNLLLNPFLAVAVVTAVAIGTMSMSALVMDKIIEGVKLA
jgi:hypothetical protein